MSSDHYVVDQSEVDEDDVESYLFLGRMAWAIVWGGVVFALYHLATPVVIIPPRSNFSEVFNIIVPAYAALVIWLYGGTHVTPAYKLCQRARTYPRFAPLAARLDRPNPITDEATALYHTLQIGVPFGVFLYGLLLLVGYSEALYALTSDTLATGVANDLVYINAFGVSTLFLLLSIVLFTWLWFWLFPSDPSRFIHGAAGSPEVEHE